MMMTSAETIYNPASDELSDRLKAFQSVVQAYGHISQAKASNGLEHFGDEAEVENAKAIISRSMQEASQALGANDLERAEELGLLTNKQAREYAIMKQQIEFEMLKQGTAQSSRHSQS